MTDRAVNTVVDVAFAILFVAVAMALLSTLSTADGTAHDPLEADRTAVVVASSTLNVTYPIEEVPDRTDSGSNATTSGLSDDELTRSAHGSIASQVGDAAVANVTAGRSKPLTNAGQRYERALDERVQSTLVGSNFETNVTAVWVPYEGATVGGKAAVGATPPPGKSTSTAVLTVPSGIEPVREEAVDAVEAGGSYEELAGIVAAVVVEGYFPVPDSKHALERNDVERMRTLHRYERMAALVDRAEADADRMQEALERHHAEPSLANEYLKSKLAAQLATDMEASFDSPDAAARAVSAGEVTVTVRTWEP